MKTIFLLLIFLVLGVLFGFIFARLVFFIYTFLLRRKISKDVLNEPKQFFYKLQPYDLKKEIEKEKSKRKKFNLFEIFKKKLKGGKSENGHTLQSGTDESIGTEQVSALNRSVGESVPGTEPGNAPIVTPRATGPTATPEDRGEQKRINPPETRGNGTNFSRNLFKKGKKLD